MKLRMVATTDSSALQEIGKKTFFETFAASNTTADMKGYLDRHFSKEQMSKELTDPNSEFYFAQDASSILGYLKINWGSSQTEAQLENTLEIERIYVLKQFQGRGVGQVLFEKALSRAKDIKANYIWLGVWENNPQAIAFYKKNGFKVFGHHIFKLGNDEQTDLMMKLDLITRV